jgi:hypothetical protein
MGTRLNTLLKVEQQLDMTMQAISSGKQSKETAIMLISQAILCIMHLKNYVREKLINVLIARAAESTKVELMQDPLAVFFWIASNLL